MSSQHKKDAGEIDVRYVGNLARLHLSDEEVHDLQQQLEQIVEHVKQLDEVNVDGIEPTSHAIPMQNVYREDVCKPSINREAVLDNAPSERGGHIMVPRIIEE